MVSTTLDRPGEESSPWFISWFNSTHYHKLYAYRDDAEAARFVDELLGRLRFDEGAAVLDLGCGTGRHSKYLASRGLRVTGIDLSASSIKAAKRSEREALRFVQHDMREPFGKNKFDCVFSFFTSFGYFEDPAEHLIVISNIANSLKAGGRLVLDYLNVRYAEGCATRDEERTIDGSTYRMTRWSDIGCLFKHIMVEDAAGECGEYLERVAKFTVEDFEWMFSLYGLRIEAVYGDYRLNPYDRDASPRMILEARKAMSASAISERISCVFG